MLTVRVIVNVTVPVTRARACLAASVGDSDRDSGSLTRNLNLNHDDTVITDGLQRLQKQPATVTFYKSAYNGYKSS